MTYTKPQPEFPRRARHYFKVPLPEMLRNEQTEADAFIDVLITDVPGTIGYKHIEITEHGVIFEGAHIQPSWVAPEVYEAEKKKVCIK